MNQAADNSPKHAPRSAIALLAVLAVLICIACSGVTEPPDEEDYPPPPPWPPPSGRDIVLVDNFGAWSPSGDEIAYHRAIPSDQGPQGVYIIGASGGESRFVSPGDWVNPTKLEYCPCGGHIVGVFAGQLIEIDVDAGQTRQLGYTNNGVDGPAYDPTGNLIAYTRTLRREGEPEDSVGLFIYDRRTGRHSPMGFHYALDPDWSPDGQWIVFAHNYYLVRLNPRTRESHRVTTRGPSAIHENPIWLPDGHTILYEEMSTKSPRTWSQDAFLPNLKRKPWPWFVQPTAGISFDFTKVILPHLKQLSSEYDGVVLAVHDFAAGEFLYQLTDYELPSEIDTTNKAAAEGGGGNNHEHLR